ncbi:low temperature requirement protein A [Actinophytocola sp.]|uniref:low temperature requirement protein A n=1 Tax=Actinophytocola sp. TaxID=1872138 RepID=UPI003D6A6E96
MAQGPEPADRHASWLELFFDLVVVVAVSQLAHLLHGDAHHAPGALDIVTFFALYLAIWLVWTTFMLYANVVADRVRVPTVFLGMAGFAVLAASIPEVLTERADLFARRVPVLQHPRQRCVHPLPPGPAVLGRGDAQRRAAAVDRLVLDRGPWVAAVPAGPGDDPVVQRAVQPRRRRRARRAAQREARAGGRATSGAGGPVNPAARRSGRRGFPGWRSPRWTPRTSGSGSGCS